MREPPPTARQLAARLLASESPVDPRAPATAASQGPTLAVGSRSLERLRAELEPLVGDIGYRALLARALALAKREVDWLDAVTVGPDGSLQGLEDAERSRAPGERSEVAMEVLAHVLGLLVTFVGEDLTARLVSKACPEAPGQDADARVEEKSK